MSASIVIAMQSIEYGHLHKVGHSLTLLTCLDWLYVAYPAFPGFVPHSITVLILGTLGTFFFVLRCTNQAPAILCT